MSDTATALRFVCVACATVHVKWSPRCSSCTSSNGLVSTTAAELIAKRGAAMDEEGTVSRPRLMIARSPSPESDVDDPEEELRDILPANGPVAITDIAEMAFVRDSTGLAPVDYVLGGGLVAASVVLLASPRGIGKSSLTLQVLSGLGHRCLYVSGEETLAQVRGTAGRIGALTPRLFVLSERDLATIFAHAKAMRAKTIAIDSIQKMICHDVGGRSGSHAQVKECTAQLVDYAKHNDTALWIIGHVTGKGDIAGPETIEHEVDVVLELTKGTKFEGNERILRCLDKNRFGASDRLGHFELTATGLVTVDLDGWDKKL